jgi:hypothetical protein
LNARNALSSISLRRLLAAAALVVGFGAASAPARADDPVTVGDYTTNTTPPPTDKPDSYGTGDAGDSYGTGSYGTGGTDPDSYGTGSYGTGDANPDSYGTG